MVTGSRWSSPFEDGCYDGDDGSLCLYPEGLTQKGVLMMNDTEGDGEGQGASEGSVALGPIEPGPPAKLKSPNGDRALAKVGRYLELDGTTLLAPRADGALDGEYTASGATKVSKLRITSSVAGPKPSLRWALTFKGGRTLQGKLDYRTHSTEVTLDGCSARLALVRRSKEWQVVVSSAQVDDSCASDLLGEPYAIFLRAP